MPSPGPSIGTDIIVVSGHLPECLDQSFRGGLSPMSKLGCSVPPPGADVVGSCSKLAARSHLTSFREIAITTGRKHGAFFGPLPEWVRSLRAWIAETNR